MDKYSKHQLYDYPAVAAVIDQHLAENYIKNNDYLTKFSLLEKNLKNLTSQLEHLISQGAQSKGYCGVDLRPYFDPNTKWQQT